MTFLAVEASKTAKNVTVSLPKQHELRFALCFCSFDFGVTIIVYFQFIALPYTLAVTSLSTTLSSGSKQ